MEASGQSEASIVSRLCTPIVFQTLAPVINRYSKHKQWQQFLWNILGKWNNVARSEVDRQKYRVIFDNLHQELTCYSLVLGLLKFFKASM